jgi:hypothetical protein
MRSNIKLATIGSGILLVGSMVALAAEPSSNPPPEPSMQRMEEHMRMMETMRAGGKGCMMKPDEQK